MADSGVFFKNLLTVCVAVVIGLISFSLVIAILLVNASVATFRKLFVTNYMK